MIYAINEAINKRIRADKISDSQLKFTLEIKLFGDNYFIRAEETNSKELVNKWIKDKSLILTPEAKTYFPEI